MSVSQAGENGASDVVHGEKQRARLLSFVAKMESRPETEAKDSFSNRDHDEVIFGGQQKGMIFGRLLISEEAHTAHSRDQASFGWCRFDT